MIGTTGEETFNQKFAEALRQTHAPWQPKDCIIVERHGLISGSNLKPDIVINDPKYPPLNIETSFHARDADQDVTKYLGRLTKISAHPIHTSVAVHIPGSFRKTADSEICESLLSGAEVRYAVHRENRNGGRWPGEGFIVGAIHDIKTLLLSLAIPDERISEVGQEVANLVRDTANILAARLSDNDQDLLSSRLLQRSPLNGLRTMMVLWLNALLVQRRLELQVEYGRDNHVPVVPSASEEPPLDPRERLKVWESIHGHNWRSIFQPAIEVLRESISLDPGATSSALSILDECVRKIEYAQIGLHISVGAELFPVLSDDRKAAAAFYTRPSTAEMLADLTISQENMSEDDWADPFLFRSHKLVDMACGTGTLLRAGYRRIVDLHERNARKNADICSMHTAAMEGGLIGADISPIAAHLTTSSLASIGEGDTYGDTQIGWIGIGGKGHKTGALEYFKTDNVNDLFSDPHIGKTSGSGKYENISVDIPEGKIDWILMNPPYKRSDGKQGAFDVSGLSDKERKECQERWGRLIRNKAANKSAGLGASFLVLADIKCKQGGRIGFVLPLTAAFGVEWIKTRKMIEEKYSEITIITVSGDHSYREGSLSADTGMGEMLLVATKVGSRREGPNKKCNPNRIYSITLRKPVVRLGEAREAARAIKNLINEAKNRGQTYCPVRIGDDTIGEFFAFPVGGEGDPWSPLGVLHKDLVVACRGLREGKLSYTVPAIPLGVSMVKMSDLFTIGPDEGKIGNIVGGDQRGAFEVYPVADKADASGTDRMLWRADKSKQKKLIVDFTHKGVPWEEIGSSQQVERVLGDQSTLFYAKNMRWTSQKLLSAMTENPGMGGRAWVSLAHNDGRIRKAFVLWANSTLGFLVHWTYGTRTQVGRSTTRIKAIANLPCPRLDEIPEARLCEAENMFDEIAQRELLPACQAHVDEVRQQIDQAVVKMFNLDLREAIPAINMLRSHWCYEPTVHGNNRKALELLEMP